MIERGETWILDTDMRVYTLTVEGTLIWDTTKDDLKLSAKYVLGKITYHKTAYFVRIHKFIVIKFF